MLTTEITEEFLSNYKILRINGSTISGSGISETESNIIYNWVMGVGKLFADVSFTNSVLIVYKFGVQDIEGQNGGSSGLSGYFYGHLLLFHPLMVQ
jgi:hypothetical protein